MDLLFWLEQSTLAQLVRVSLYPFVQIVHIISFAVLIGAIGIFDLRLLGYFPKLPIVEIAKSLLPLARHSFSFATLSGFLLFSAQPVVLVANPMFQFKLLLIVLAGVNAVTFHVASFGSMKRWEQHTKVPTSARIIAVISLFLWVAIIACGRLIAYS
ncbi:hypothetical protein A6S26_07480 [Nostoc sp. ATCC 43529]|nr:hypothetical protein A6S26_07480 [Nostoc sp. ATCC 43529]